MKQKSVKYFVLKYYSSKEYFLKSQYGLEIT